MKRILFVDDQEPILDGLRRMLRGMRSEWEMEFVDTGEKALALLDEKPFDVVVSDMLMPGMDGAKLLGEVAQRHPATARIILSGHAGQDMIFKCIGTTHQFLAKPCDAATLKATIQRITTQGLVMDTPRFKELIGSLDKLPTIPAIYSQIMAAVQDPDVTLESVGDIIAQDPSLTAKILKLVNSAYFGLRREISSPATATSYLGLDTIKSLVLSLQAFDQFETGRIRGLNLDRLWNHSMSTGALARQLSTLESADIAVREAAFTAGLLHDLGKVILAYNFPDEYQKVAALADGGEMGDVAAEQEVFGTTHPQIGGYLLGLWGLPEAVVEAISLHHSPSTAAEPAANALWAVHVANVLAHESAQDRNGSADNQ
ncbi:MAG TPA: two-component system response regulator, partial [Verrucomicrobiales bacterium]|nr:two-component system response regulator [Verrucomicrobiales bacterium]